MRDFTENGQQIGNDVEISFSFKFLFTHLIFDHTIDDNFQRLISCACKISTILHRK